MIWFLVLVACSSDSAKDRAGSDSAGDTNPCGYGYDDVDGDGFGGTWAWSCNVELSQTQDDCDDQNSAVNPNAVETCASAVDENCDGNTNDPDALGCSDWYADRDSDGFGGSDVECLCQPEVPFTVTERGDCDDTSDEVVPGDGMCGLWGEMSLTDAGATLLGAPIEIGLAGWNVAIGGDINGDGLGDLVVSTPEGVGADAGAVYVVSGVPSGESSLADADAVISGHPDWWFGWSIAGAGDLDGDGYSDVLAGSPGREDDLGAAWLLPGPLEGALDPETAGIRLDATSDAIGVDVSGTDLGGGVKGLWVSFGYQADLDQGGVYLLAGHVVDSLSLDDACSAVVTHDGGPGLEGAGVDGGGDVDGDGVSDLILGSPDHYSGGAWVGAAWLHRGPFSGVRVYGDADMTLTGETEGDQVGSSVALTGDNDGDGLADVMIGAPGADESVGVAAWFPGTTLGVVVLGDAGASIHGRGDDASEDTSAGAVVARAGDQDLDGLEDVLVPIWGSYVVYMFAAPLSGTVTGEHASGRIRYDPGDVTGLYGQASSVAASDINADGWPDVLVGSSLDDYSHDRQGAAYLFLGGGL